MEFASDGVIQKCSLPVWAAVSWNRPPLSCQQTHVLTREINTMLIVQNACIQDLYSFCRITKFNSLTSVVMDALLIIQRGNKGSSAAP